MVFGRVTVWVSRGCLEGVWKGFGRGLEGVWKVYGSCLEGFLNPTLRTHIDPDNPSKSTQPDQFNQHDHPKRLT